jgi:hypothetical protein
MASRISFIFFQIVPLVAALWIPTFGAAESQARCPTNLSYLEKVIPRYPGDPDITEMRNKILQENISLDLDRAHQQGYSTAQAAKAALDQAREAQRVEAGVKQTALSTCPDHDTNPGPCDRRARAPFPRRMADTSRLTTQPSLTGKSRRRSRV